MFLRDVVLFCLMVVLEGLLVHVAALLVLRASQAWRAVLVAALGSLVARSMGGLPEGLYVWGLVASFIVWVALVAILFRTTWVRATVVGLLAYTLWIASNALVNLDWSRMAG